MSTMSQQSTTPEAGADSTKFADMEPAVARRILRRSDRADEALRDIETAIQTGKVFCGIETLFYPKPNSAVDYDRGDNGQLKPHHWARIVNDKQRDNFWADGQADLRASNGHRAVNLRGIRFSGAELRAFADSYNAPPAPTPDPQGRAGRKPKLGDWDDFWLAVVDLAKKGRLTTAHFTSRTHLASTLVTEIEEGLSPATVEPKVQLIWDMFVQPPGRKS